MSIRVCILTNIPARSRIPLFRRIAAATDLKVVFDAVPGRIRQWEDGEEFGFPHAFAAGIAARYRRRCPPLGVTDERYLQVRYDVIPQLIRFRPDVVVSAEMGLRSLQARMYAKSMKIPLILWSEGTPHSEGWVGGTKLRLRRYLVRFARRVWVNGNESAALAMQYGAKGGQVDTGMIGIDSRAFSEQVRRDLPAREAIRARLGVSGRVLLFVGKLVPRKGISEYLEALKRVRGETSRPFTALFAGDGPEVPHLQQLAESNPELGIRLAGFVPPKNLSEVYAAADYFVLPSLDDNWSLATLEAAAAGLPQVFSKFNGATSDLMQLGATGTCINPYDVQMFASVLKGLVEGPRRKAPDHVVERIVNEYSPETCVGRALKSIEQSVGEHRWVELEGCAPMAVKTAGARASSKASGI
jgi:glycosyltransferase involved in cell wall biosynthesis